MNEMTHLKGVSTLKLDQNACIGCGMCEVVCPRRVMKLDNLKARIHKFDNCIECGACALNCPVDAIEVTPGVGCASYIIQTWIKGKDAPTCCGYEC